MQLKITINEDTDSLEIESSLDYDGLLMAIEALVKLLFTLVPKDTINCIRQIDNVIDLCIEGALEAIREDK